MRALAVRLLAEPPASSDERAKATITNGVPAIIAAGGSVAET
jgi:hypothetical protein